MSNDYYTVLGVDKNASEDDIRKAYKKIALKDHPDRNPGDKAAEERFKAANEAYSILSDTNKRAQYDRGGVNSFQEGFNGFAGFDDMFAEIFGVRRQNRQQGPQKGNDVRLHAQISLREAMTGCKKEINIDIPEICASCSGSGAHEGKSLVNCNHCNGTGNIREVMGTMMFSQTCGYCGGRGKTIDKKCVSCNAQGSVNKNKKINVNFPAGINSGNNLKISGQGQSSQNGGPNGDIYVVVEVIDDKKFKRSKNDLATQLNISVAEAILGAKKEITLPDDSTINVIIPPGSQPDYVITVNNAGMPDLRSSNVRGNLFIELNVEIPRYISENAANLIKQFDEEIKK